MSNWTSITTASVKTAKISSYIATAQSAAAARGEADPLPEIIADVVAQIRASISVGNRLDADPTKIPNSLNGLAKRMIIRQVKDYINSELKPSEAKQADQDLSYLNRIVDHKIRFEIPDSPADSAEQQPPLGPTFTTNRHRHFGRRAEEGM
jgi:hypothetical protein